MRSECFYSGPGVERTMSYWHENGARRMQGPAVDGVRTGRWRVWFADGALAEEGDYAGGLRTGSWQVREGTDQPFRSLEFTP
jgi:antitoxin component YwqK of YwqJK toxin-antitoxin module